MNKAFAYIRPKRAISQSRQRREIERYAQRSGLVVTKWYEETNVSALGARPRFRHLLKDLATGKASVVITDKHDRFSRRLPEWAEIAELVEKRGVQLHFACQRPNRPRASRNFTRLPHSHLTLVVKTA